MTTPSFCAHHWIYRGPGTAECSLCGEWDIRQRSTMPICEPYCAVVDQPQSDSLREFCADCGSAWELRPVTEVEADGTPVQTVLGWVRI